MSKASTPTTEIQASMRLMELCLENFKGVRSFVLNAVGQNTRVLGDNAAGKTTLADGFSWLLFGKDSQGHADFEIKTLDIAGQALHGLDHAVEAELDIDGKTINLRKVYREKWTKRRGSAEKELAGNTRDHFVDGVPVTQGEYEERITGLADEKAFRLLTNPFEFAERIHWQERRHILLEVCGDISDADVIAPSQDLADLTGILSGRSIDDHRKVVQAQRRKINEELERIPIRIDETSRGLPELVGDTEKFKPELDVLRIQRRDAETARSRIEMGGEIAEKTKRLREIEAEILSEANKESAARQVEVNQLRTKLAHEQSCLDDKSRCVARFEKDIGEAEKELPAVKSQMAMLRNRWHHIDSEEFAPVEGGDVCAACGQALPEERVIEARSKALAEFNASKATQLIAIVDEGKTLGGRHDMLTALIDSNGEQLRKAKKAESDVTKPIVKLKEEIEVLTAYHVDAPCKNVIELLKEKLNARADIEKLQENNLGSVEEAKRKITGFDETIAAVERVLSKIEQRRIGEKRIENLGRMEHRLAGEFEELERQLYLLDEFTRRKVSMLTNQINSRFELVRYKLFNVLVNGGLEECCDVTHDGVPWSSLNTGAQVNIGLDVIRTLSQHYGMAPPIFVDHAESVTKLLDTPGQQIRLVVSENDKELRVEEAK